MPLNPDNRLPYPPEAVLVAPGWGPGVAQVGFEPVYYDPKPGQIVGQFDRNSGNRVIIPRDVGVENFKLAVSYILGTSTIGGPNGQLIRNLPISDGQGLGMVANRIVGFRLLGDTGKKIYPGDVDVGAGTFNYDGGGPPDTTTTAFKGKRYCRLDVEFWHPPYAVIADGLLPSFIGGELARFCWGEFNDAFEFNTSEALITEWDAAAPINPGRPIANGPGFPRPTGELIIHWERVPVSAWVKLQQKYIDNAYYGKINNGNLIVPFYDQKTITFHAEELMFMSARAHLRWQAHGVPEYDIDFHFQGRFNAPNPGRGWNYFQEPTTGTYQLLRRAARPPLLPGFGEPVFDGFDFTELFRTDH